MDFSVISSNLPLYVEGLATTLQLVVASLVLGMLLALPLALMSASTRFVVRVLPLTFMYFFRGTPLLVQAFMIYHGFAQFDSLRESILWVVLKEAYWCALLAFTLNTAAYTAEIIRGAIKQTPVGEIEAAKACGMTRAMTMRRVILPGALRRALPAYGNEVIFMLHGSAVAGVITIVDLFGAARIVSSRHFAPFEAFLAAGAFYLMLTFCIVGLFKVWESRWHAHVRVRA